MYVFVRVMQRAVLFLGCGWVACTTAHTFYDTISYLYHVMIVCMVALLQTVVCTIWSIRIAPAHYERGLVLGIVRAALSWYFHIVQ